MFSPSTNSVFTQTGTNTSCLWLYTHSARVIQDPTAAFALEFGAAHIIIDEKPVLSITASTPLLHIFALIPLLFIVALLPLQPI